VGFNVTNNILTVRKRGKDKRRGQPGQD